MGRYGGERRGRVHLVGLHRFSLNGRRLALVRTSTMLARRRRRRRSCNVILVGRAMFGARYDGDGPIQVVAIFSERLVLLKGIPPARIIAIDVTLVIVPTTMFYLRPFFPLEVLNSRVCSRRSPAPGSSGYDGCLEYLQRLCTAARRSMTYWDSECFALIDGRSSDDVKN